jgi:hypothetical protein
MNRGKFMKLTNKTAKPLPVFRKARPSCCISYVFREAGTVRVGVTFEEIVVDFTLNLLGFIALFSKAKLALSSQKRQNEGEELG